MSDLSPELEKAYGELVPGGIQWYPGHMAKATRELKKYLKLVDTVVEVVDARVPASSRHPNLQSLASGKHIVIALTKHDLAHPQASAKWSARFRQENQPAFLIDAGRGTGLKALLRAIQGTKSTRRVLVVGVPNTGKSTLINRLCRRSATRTGARPGVTKGPQWLQAGRGVELLDTPGLLWPKIGSLLQGLKLVWVGSVGENAYDAGEVGAALALWMQQNHLDALEARYNIELGGESALAILEQIGKRRGCLVSGGRVDLAKAGNVLLQDFRAGHLGRITLDSPPTDEGEAFA